MRIAICDDDRFAVEQIQAYIHLYFRKKKIKLPEVVCFYNGETLLADKEEIDILFLDIEMPGINGIYIGKELKKRNDKIMIFIVTAYVEYLDEAMRFDVFRYLSKPLEKQRFFRNFKDALRVYNTINVKIPIETKQGIYIVPASDILTVESQQRKVIVHTVKSDFESIHTMKYWLDCLPENCFFQTHRSFIVNFEHIEHFDHTLISMDEKQVCAYLTRRKYGAFKDAYFLYLEGMR